MEQTKFQGQNFSCHRLRFFFFQGCSFWLFNGGFLFISVGILFFNLLQDTFFSFSHESSSRYHLLSNTRSVFVACFSSFKYPVFLLLEPNRDVATYMSIIGMLLSANFGLYPSLHVPETNNSSGWRSLG